MSDDFTLDFSDTEAMGAGFDAIPAGWYGAVISDYDDTETRNEGKIPQGTPGTNWEFTIDEGDFDGRKQWTNHWHHPKTLGFLKNLFLATGKFTEEELNGQIDLNEARDRCLGAPIAIQVKQKTWDGEKRNEVKGIKPRSELEQKQTSTSSSLLP